MKNILTDRQVRGLQAGEKIIRKADGSGLYLRVMPNGSKHWEYIYKKNRKRTSKSLGKYPIVSLREAREKRDNLKNGLPPSSLTYKNLKDAYFEHHAEEWTEKTKQSRENMLKRYFPQLLETALTDITPSDISSGLQTMKDRKLTEAIRKAGTLLKNSFKYGITMGILTKNPMRDIDVHLFIQKERVRHYAHITDKKVLKALLCAINTYKGLNEITRAAMEFAVHVFVRPGNIRAMLKEEIDFEKKLWTIPAEKMKMSRDHVVPLTEQTISILKRAIALNPNSKYVFPSPYSDQRPLSENTLNNSFKRLGVCKITSHGLRHTASTFLNESGRWRPDLIEMQLAHVDKNIIRATYNKALWLDERRKMMEWWSNFLIDLSQDCQGGLAPQML